MNFVNDKIPFVPNPPGRIIKRSLEAENISPLEFAKKHRLEPTEFCAMLEGAVPLTAKIAKTLARVWGTDEDFWLRLEADYQQHPKGSGGKRLGAGRKPTGVVSKQVRISAKPEEMQQIQAWLEAQQSAANRLGQMILRELQKS